MPLLWCDKRLNFFKINHFTQHEQDRLDEATRGEA